MEHDTQGLGQPSDSAIRRELAGACPVERPAGRQWLDPSICPRGADDDCACFRHAFPAAETGDRPTGDRQTDGRTTDGQHTGGGDAAASFRWIGPAGVERRLSERAELLWRKLAGPDTMPDSARIRELLRPPFLGQSLLVETSAAEPKRIAFVGEALAALTGLHSDSPAGDATPLGARLVRLAARSAREGRPCRYESDLPSVEKSGADGDRFLTRAIALPFAATSFAPSPFAPSPLAAPPVATPPIANTAQQAAGYSIVVVASWRKLLSAEETRALHRELAAAIDWMHRQGS